MNTFRSHSQSINSAAPSVRGADERLPRVWSSLRGWLYSAALALPLLLQAQSFTIDWYSLDGGGGTSTGGVFSVNGTLGQPDAGSMSGGVFTLSGGFWGVLAVVQNPAGPRLELALSSTNYVFLSWPESGEVWQLQSNPVLSAAGWSDITNAPASIQGKMRVVLPLRPGNQFYRLKK